METLTEAKQFLRANFEQGCECPACGQYVRLYKRKLNSGMAIFIIGLYKLMKKDLKRYSSPRHHNNFHSNKDVFDVMNIKVTSLDYSVIRHFGLIEARMSDDSKRDSGYWRLTEEGIHFASGSDFSPKYVYLYNNKRQGVSDEKITIKEALGDKFDYEELMKNR